MNEDILNKYNFILAHPEEEGLYDAPIAVFDSGVGGISVLRELVKLMPNENFLYYGDSANAPYGTKSLEEVQKLTIGHVEDFMMRPVKGVCIACNTATSAAVRKLREMYPTLPLVGIEPALKPAALSGDRPRVLVLATPMTINQEKFNNLLARYQDQADVYPLACPGLMELVESGQACQAYQEIKSSGESKAEEDIIFFLEELLGSYRGQVDAVVLGCTHYPFVKKEIASILGDDVQIFDGGYGTAKEMKRRILEAHLERRTQSQGRVIFENSLESQDKIDLCRRLLG